MKQKIKNQKIIICRHAESIEDIDNNIYDKLKDLDIPLTDKGKKQAYDFGQELVNILKDSRLVHFYTSPGVRNIQTLDIVSSLLSPSLDICTEIEPLIVKQDWGKINSENKPEIEAERYKTGVLRYEFPTGESAKSLIQRLTKFKEKIIKIQKNTNSEIVVFSHGFEFRVLLMLFMGWDEELFESFGNLENCEFRILTKKLNNKYELDRPLKKHGLPITRLLNKK